MATVLKFASKYGKYGKYGLNPSTLSVSILGSYLYLANALKFDYRFQTQSNPAKIRNYNDEDRLTPSYFFDYRKELANKETLLQIMASRDIPIVIGITGKAGHGKNTVGDMLTVGYGFKQIALADPLKRGVAEIYNLPLEHFYDPVLKEQIIPRTGTTPRRLLQIIGTDIFRKHFEENFWIKIMGWKIEDELAKAKAQNVSPPNFVITDVRFDNEAQAIRTMVGAKGYIVQVDASERLANVHTETELSSDAKAHVTEQGISPSLVDVIVKNDASLENLKEYVDKTALFLMGKASTDNTV